MTEVQDAVDEAPAMLSSTSRFQSAEFGRPTSSVDSVFLYDRPSRVAWTPAQAQTRLQHVSRVIHKWLPSASTMGLWVCDSRSLYELIGRLEKDMDRVYREAAPGASDEFEQAAERLYETACELDEFLSSAASV